MPAVCFYFQVHQPYRLRRYSVFDAGPDYFHDAQNAELMRRVAAKCYRPTLNLFHELIERTGGRFKVSFSITGAAIEQFKEFAPDVIDLLQQLGRTGCCEFLAETYHHSLSALYSQDEFLAQLDLHAGAMEELFLQTPSVFRNTELIYSNAVAQGVAELDRHHAILAEGVGGLLAGATPHALRHPPGLEGLPVLLKDHKLSDDIAFRFSDRSWSEYPMTAPKYAEKLAATDAGPDAHGRALVNLFMDLETFGEHQWSETGIFSFLEALPAAVLERGGRFLTPSEALDEFEPIGPYDAPHVTSWADTERDLSAWVGNAMQSSALQDLYKLEAPVKAAGDARLLDAWRKLTCSDHFYYMSTKYHADGDVHQYFSPYESPYDAYINYMNVLDNLRTRVRSIAEPG
ncbi:MAG: glycoside hydrolase family 57 protein [Planctomycetota bacterium]